MRILVRHGFSRDLADLLVDDLRRCLDYFEKHPVENSGNEGDSSSYNHTGFKSK